MSLRISLLSVFSTALALGETFREPPVIRSQNGVLTSVLNVQVKPTSIGGRTLQTVVYNGMIPGPTWRVKGGDTLKVQVNNLQSLTPGKTTPITGQCAVPAAMPTHDHSSMAAMDPLTPLFTNIHTHGLQVTPNPPPNAKPGIWGDNPFIDIKPGDACNYEIPIPADQPAGLFWYHPHRHMNSSKQSWAGMAGAIVVEGAIDQIPEIKAAKERLMIIQELWLDNQNGVPKGLPVPTAGVVQFSSIPATPHTVQYAINGVSQPTIDIQPGEVQRWRILAAGPHRFFQFSLINAQRQKLPYYQIAQDGLAFATPKKVDTLLVTPGNRVEILVVGPPAGTKYTLIAGSYDQGHPGGALPELQLGTMQSAGAVIAGMLPAKLVTPQTIGAASVRRQLVFHGELLPNPVEFFLNGKQFDGTTQVKVKVGTTEEWTLVNTDIFQHPFHIHVNPFQVVETGDLVRGPDGKFIVNPDGTYKLVNPKPVVNPIWWDTFALPPFGYAKVRMRYRPDVVGKTVYHCHILPHEDNGMMAAFELVK